MRYGDPLAGSKFRERHGRVNTTAYRSWQSMKQRCANPNSINYSYYGGRGIKVCDRWINSFAAFCADMGEPPTPEHTLERADADGDYEPENCCWADKSAQAANQRTRKDNTSGFIGVHKNKQRWGAEICWQGKHHYVGTFDTPEEAATWRDAYIIANEWPHTLNFLRSNTR